MCIGVNCNCKLMCKRRCKYIRSMQYIHESVFSLQTKAPWNTQECECSICLHNNLMQIHSLRYFHTAFSNNKCSKFFYGMTLNIVFIWLLCHFNYQLPEHSCNIMFCKDASYVRDKF